MNLTNFHEYYWFNMNYDFYLLILNIMSYPTVTTTTCASGYNCGQGSLCTSNSQCASGYCCGNIINLAASCSSTATSSNSVVLNNGTL